MAKKHIAFDTIAEFEDFRSKPYWDVNHWRVGYGSDTYVGTDGRVHTVKKKTRVTREQADADLNRRISEAEKGIIREIGQDAWDKLSDGARIAAVDTAYNYGSLDELSSLKKALVANDPEKIAKALEKYKTHNDSVNAHRRQKMADLVRNEAAGHPIPKVNVGETDVATEVDIGLPELDVGGAGFRPPLPRERPKQAPIPMPGRPLEKKVAPTPMPSRGVSPTKLPSLAIDDLQGAGYGVQLTEAQKKSNPVGEQFAADDPIYMGTGFFRPTGLNKADEADQLLKLGKPQTSDKANQTVTEAKKNVEKSGGWSTFPRMETTNGVGNVSGFDKKKFATETMEVLAPSITQPTVKVRESGIAPAPNPNASQPSGIARKVNVVTQTAGGATRPNRLVAGEDVLPVDRPKVPIVPATKVATEAETRAEQTYSRLHPAAQAMIQTGAVPASTLPTLSIAPPTPMPGRPLSLDKQIQTRLAQPAVEVIPPQVSAPAPKKTTTVQNRAPTPRTKPVSNFTSSGRTRASVGETSESVWAEASGG